MSDRPKAIQAVEALKKLEGKERGIKIVNISHYPDKCVSDALIEMLLAEEEPYDFSFLLMNLLPFRFVELDRALLDEDFSRWDDRLLYILCKRSYQGILESIWNNVEGLFASESWIRKLAACHYMLNSHEYHDMAIKCLESLAGSYKELEYVEELPSISFNELSDPNELKRYVGSMLKKGWS